jgi:nucleoside-diphosphate-sugar epimerase
MRYLVAGVGYTGMPVLNSLQDAVGVSRRRPADCPAENFAVRDLDAPVVEPIDTGSNYSLLYSIPPRPGPKEDMRLAAFLNALSSAPKRIVYLSTSGVYGNHGGEPIDESVLPEPQNGRSMRRWKVEKQLLNYCNNTGCEATILRVPGIYGPYRLGLQRIEKRLPIICEADAHPGNRIHVDDLVSCCLAALDDDTPAGIYNVSDGDFSSSSWFTITTARLGGFPLPPEVTRQEANATFGEKRLSFLGEFRRLDTTRMREILGVTPKYTDPLDGIRASLAASGRRRDSD